ncbi:MAG: multicopper oxidase domain-containing protein, partial [Bryobacteraceae bacterium]
MEKKVMTDRRRFFRNALSFGLGAGLVSAAQVSSGKTPARVQSPDLRDLSFRLDNGVKVFHLAAEPVKQQLAPKKTLDLWGYNGSAPGPTIQVNQGDRVRIVFDNHLPEPTSMHWHGFEIPNDMDGAPGLTQ